MNNPGDPQRDPAEACHHGARAGLDGRRWQRRVTYTTTGNLTGVDHVHFQIDDEPVKMDLTLDGTYTFSGIHVGSHTLNGWLVRADHTKISGSDAIPVASRTSSTRPIRRRRPSPSLLPPTAPGLRGRSSIAGRRTTSESTASSSSSTARTSASRTLRALRRELGHDDDRQRRAHPDGGRPRHRRQRDDVGARHGDRLEHRRRPGTGRASGLRRHAADHPGPYEHAPERQAPHLRQRHAPGTPRSGIRRRHLHAGSVRRAGPVLRRPHSDCPTGASSSPEATSTPTSASKTRRSSTR